MMQDLSQKVNSWDKGGFARERRVSELRSKYDRKRKSLIGWSLACVSAGGFLVGLACGLYF
jgi:hypothetical protein